MFVIAYKSNCFLVIRSLYSLTVIKLLYSYLMAAGFTNKGANDFSKWLQEEGFNENVRKIFEG